jgi:hypothetical protein
LPLLRIDLRQASGDPTDLAPKEFPIGWRNPPLHYYIYSSLIQVWVMPPNNLHLIDAAFFDGPTSAVVGMPLWGMTQPKCEITANTVEPVSFREKCVRSILFLSR